VLGGLELSVESGPTGNYGSGFAWYRMGLTQMRPGQTKLLIKALPQDGVEMAIDAVLLAHPSFTPNGLRKPPPFRG
jgi:hypothetical protein